MKNQKGQILVVVVVVLLVATILVPVLVMRVQRETKYTGKQTESTSAFHEAEAGVEKGFLAISVSTQVWVSLQKGVPLAGFTCDVQYTDVPSGRYCVSITSGPATQQATIISIGQDSLHKETRAIKTIYSNSFLSDIGIDAANGVTMSGSNVQVEWGSIVSPKTITISSKLHPRFYSAGSIDLDTNGANPPNCDQPNCWWWWSYYQNIPPTPAIDFNFYKSSAQASGTAPCGMKYYVPASSTPWSTDCNDTSGKPFYVEGDWTSFTSSMNGPVIVLGSLTYSNGSQPSLSSYGATVPSKAWKNYCNDWSSYTVFDSTFPYSGCATTPTSYTRTGITYSISPSIHGLLYVGGDLTIPNGGGNAQLVHGVIVVMGTANISTNSNAKIFYDASVGQNMQTTTILLTRSSWQDFVIAWPASLP